jgi:hypothetical protein
MATSWIVRQERRIGAALAALLLSAAPAAAQQASQAQRDAIRQACPADYQAHCANVPAAGQAAFACLARNVAQLSPACQRAVAAVSGGAAPGGASSNAAPPPSGAPYARAAPQAAPMTPRQKLMMMRQSCGGDFYAFCRGVPFGGGRALTCLSAHAGSLSPQCGQALSAARGNR